MKYDGTLEGMLDGSLDGIDDGMLDGSLHGIDDDTLEGMLMGSGESVLLHHSSRGKSYNHRDNRNNPRAMKIKGRR